MPIAGNEFVWPTKKVFTILLVNNTALKSLHFAKLNEHFKKSTCPWSMMNIYEINRTYKHCQNCRRKLRQIGFFKSNLVEVKMSESQEYLLTLNHQNPYANF